MLPISLKAAFERCLRDQIYGHIDTIQGSMWVKKGFHTQYSLINMIEK